MADGTTATATVSAIQNSANGTRGMKLAVLHRTTFHYATPVSQSVNSLHLEPRTFPYQKTTSALIRVVPATRLRRFTDLFQNITHHFELPTAHSKLEIESRIRVHNLPLDISDESREATAEGFKDSSIRERIWPYLQESRWVSRHPEVWRARSAASIRGATQSRRKVPLCSMRYRWINRTPLVISLGNF